jgi:hypothetical protein
MNGGQRAMNKEDFTDSVSAHPMHGFARDRYRSYCFGQAVGNPYEPVFLLDTAAKYVDATRMYLRLQGAAD